MSLGRLRRRLPALRVACFLALALPGCEPEPEADLARVSQEIQYDSVERLGPHHLNATIRRSELRNGNLAREVQEAQEIRWQGWDAFEMRRLVDGDVVTAVRVVEGRGWSRRADGSWVERGDPEPLRQELRLAWNAWDQALEQFDDRIALEEAGEDVVEGRRVTRFSVSLAPDPARGRVEEAEQVGDADAKGKAKGKRRRRGAGADKEKELLGLSGEVLVDEGTAVRLVARIEGEYRRGDVVHRVGLDLTRSGIGQQQVIETPEGASPGTPEGGSHKGQRDRRQGRRAARASKAPADEASQP